MIIEVEQARYILVVENEILIRTSKVKRDVVKSTHINYFIKSILKRESVDHLFKNVTNQQNLTLEIIYICPRGTMENQQ